MEIISLISGVIGLVTLIVFFIMASNVGKIVTGLRLIHEEQQKIYKALYQIAKIQMDERGAKKEL